MADLYYIESGYFDPEYGYFVYTADAASSLTSQASVTCVIGKLQDATITTQALFTPSISVEVTKNSVAVLDSTTSLSVDAVVNRSTSIALDSIVTQSLQSIRVRYFDSSLSTNFTASCDAEKIIGGVTEEGAAALSIQAALSADATRYVDVVSTQTSAFTQTTTIDKFTGIDASLLVTASQTTVVDKFINASSSLASASVITATGLRIQEGSIDLSGAFTPTLTVDVFKNSVAVLDAVATLSAQAQATKDLASVITSSASLTASASKFRLVDASISSQFTQTAVALRPTRNATITATTTPRYTDVGFSTATKKFGTASLYATATSGSTEIKPKSNAVWDGTNFKTFADGYTWTSSDGLAWTRATNNLSIGNFYPKVKYLNSNWIFVYSGLIYYSTNGTTWSTQNPGVGGGFTFENINYYSGYFYISGFGTGVGRFAVYRSTTITGTYTVAYQSGVISDYTQSTDIILNSSGLAVAYSRYNGSTYSNFLAYGSATTWTLGTIDTGVSVEANLLAHDGTTYGVAFNRNSTTIKKSTTGATSSWSTSSASVNTQPVDLAYKNSKWIVTTNNIVYVGTTIDNVASVLSNNFSTPYDSISGVEYGAAKWLYIKNGSALYSSNTTAWSEDDIESVVNMPGYVDAQLGDNTDYSQFGTMDFWINNSGNVYSRILTKFNPAGSNGFYANLDTNTLQFTIIDGVTLNGSVSTGWNHIRVSSSGGTMSLYINGTRVETATQSLASTTGQLRFFGQPSTGTVYIDEFLITDEVLTAPATTSFTVPTGEFTNTATTDLLLHFNGNFEDSSEIPKVLTAAAALSSNATLSADAIRQAELFANLSSAAILTANGDKTSNVVANLTSAFTLTASGEELAEEASASLSAEFTQTTDINRTRTVNSSLASEFTQTVQATRIQQGVIATDAVFSELAAVAKIGDFLVSLESAVSVSAQANRTRDVSATINASALVSAQANAVKDANASITSESTLTAEALRIKDSGLVTVEAFGSELAVVYVIASFFVNCQTTATVVADAKVTTGNVINAASEFALVTQTDVTKEFASSQSSTLTLTADGIKAVEADAQLVSAFTLTAQPTATLSFITTDPVVATQTAQANYIAGASASITSAMAFGLTAVDVTRDVSAQLTSNSSVNIDNQRVRYMDAQIASVSTLASSLQEIKRSSADLNASCTLLATISHIEGADLQAFANSQVSTQANVIRGANSALVSTASITALPTKLVITGANLTAQVAVNANAGKRVVAGANIASAFAPIMTYRIIHIDPYLTWRIQADVRNYKIQREDREYSIREETRQFIIKG